MGPIAADSASAQSFVLQRVQPALTGLIDGSLSTLAPIFAVAVATRQPHTAFFAGLATAIGAGISMAFSEGLSDTGEVTGRGNPLLRGSITGAGTFLGGIFHTLPFLIPQYRTALVVAVLVIAVELAARPGFAGASSTPVSCARSLRSCSAESSSPRSARALEGWQVDPVQHKRRLDAAELRGGRRNRRVPAPRSGRPDPRRSKPRARRGRHRDDRRESVKCQ
jgi:hypothetical protein